MVTEMSSWLLDLTGSDWLVIRRILTSADGAQQMKQPDQKPPHVCLEAPSRASEDTRFCLNVVVQLRWSQGKLHPSATCCGAAAAAAAAVRFRWMERNQEENRLVLTHVADLRVCGPLSLETFIWVSSASCSEGLS